MRRLTQALIALLIVSAIPAAAQAGWGVGVRIGVPIGGYYGPYYGPYYGYGYGYPYYGYGYYPAPVVVQQPVTVVQGAPAVAGTAQPAQTPALVASSSASSPSQPALPQPITQVAAREIDAYVSRLQDPDDRVRGDAVNNLGRMQAHRAVAPLCNTLASDRSPAVRDAAARALGLIADASSLEALQRAAQADDDREVRASARFAADVLRDRLRR